MNKLCSGVEAISLDVEVEEPFWWLYAYVDGRRVAYCNCELKEGGNLFIADLKVYKCVKSPMLPWWKRFLGLKRKPTNFRGEGVGRLIMMTLLEKARKEGLQSVYGYIVQKDINESAFLLEWYEKLGFQVCESDGKSMVPAVKMIRINFG